MCRVLPLSVCGHCNIPSQSGMHVVILRLLLNISAPAATSAGCSRLSVDEEEGDDEDEEDDDDEDGVWEDIFIP